MKAIELSGIHVGNWFKVSWTTARSNGKYHEYYIYPVRVFHAGDGRIDIGGKYYLSFNSWDYVYFNDPGRIRSIPYYADVVML